MKRLSAYLCAIIALFSLSASALAAGCQHYWVYQGETKGEASWVDEEVHEYELLQTDVCVKCGLISANHQGWEEEPHDLSGLKFTGEHYHKGSRHFYEYRGTCTVCDGSGVVWESVSCSGPPCPLPYSATSQVK